MNDFDDSAAICREVRNVAIELFNDKDLIEEPLRITRMLEQNFSHLPKLAELIREDIKFLAAAKAQQPSQNFTETASALESIRKAMERGLHFEEGFEQANLNFYERFFKARHEGILQSLMIRRKYKPEEWRILNAAVAGIYVYIAKAMTWTSRADLVLELLQKALPYAETSGDTKMFTKIRNNIAEEKARRPTQTFLDVAEEFESIKKNMERGLHFAEGFTQANLAFYEKIFKPRYEVTIRRLMIRRDMKLEEWRLLNFAAAMIYAQMGAAMTWAVRADLALEFYQKALPYAETSNDVKFIARVKGDINDLLKINRQIAANARRGSSGCFSVIAAVVVFLWLAL